VLIGTGVKEKGEKEEGGGGRVLEREGKGGKRGGSSSAPLLFITNFFNRKGKERREGGLAFGLIEEEKEPEGFLDRNRVALTVGDAASGEGGGRGKGEREERGE